MNRFNDDYLNFDLDGDGINTREELRLRLNPNAPDTDGDGRSDGLEVAHGSHPNSPDLPAQITDQKREQLRQRYFTHACSVLGWADKSLNYHTLFDDVGGNPWTGKALDSAVLLHALAEGEDLTNAAYLLTQSPYLQFIKQQGQLEPQQMISYIEDRIADAHDDHFFPQPDRARSGHSFERE